MVLELDDSVLDDELFKALRTMDGVMDKMEKLGLGEPPRPSKRSIPEVPKDVSTINDRELGNLYFEILGHYDWVSYHLAIAEGCRLEAKNQLEYVKAKLKNSKKKKEDIECDPSYIYVSNVLQRLSQEITILEATKSSLSNRMRAVSRDVENRRLDWEKHQRYSGIRAHRRTDMGTTENP